MQNYKKALEFRDCSLHLKLDFKEGGYHIRGPRHQNGTAKDPNLELANIIPLDGREYRRVITINDEFPGPVIRVTEGSVVKVRVLNRNLRSTI